jgi:hypothetical protein
MESKFPRPAKDIVADVGVVDAKGVVLYKYNMSYIYGDNWGLSNLTYVNPEFHSVEVQYHMKKIPFCTKKGNKPLTPEEIKHFQQLIFDTVAGSAAKSAGTKTQFKKWKIELDVKKWDQVKDKILQELIEMREKIDPWFAKQMQIVRDKKYILVHPVIRGTSYQTQIEMALKNNM